MKRKDIPASGVLTKLRVLVSGGAIAAPVGGCILAEWGADVITIETPNSPDMYRAWKYAWPADRRNVRNIVLNMFSDEGKKIMEKLIPQMDIIIESSRGGTWAKNGFSDERLWELNPKLVIAHISGFGQYGVPELIKKASYDPIGQAFSGYGLVNGDKDGLPYFPVPMVSDYLTTLTTISSCLAAYINAQDTGKGESLDLAQYEVALRYMSDYANHCFNEGLQSNDVRLPVSGKASAMFKTKDGKWRYVNAAPNYYWLLLEKLGVSRDDPRIKQKDFIYWPAGSYEFNEIFHVEMEKYAATHTAAEIDELAISCKALVGQFMEFTEMLEHPHYIARKDIIEYYDDTLKKDVKVVAPTPKFTNYPQTIWRGGPTRGMDNDDVMEELGYSPEEIQAFYDSKTISK